MVHGGAGSPGEGGKVIEVIRAFQRQMCQPLFLEGLSVGELS